MPVNIAGGDVHAGDSSASQYLDNSADSSASNEASTEQNAEQSGGGSQSVDQDSYTYQDADSEAKAEQHAVNANVPVNIAGGTVYGGDSSADQDLDNSA